MSWRAAARQGLEPRPVRSSCSLIRTGSSETGGGIRSLVAAFATVETWRCAYPGPGPAVNERSRRPPLFRATPVSRPAIGMRLQHPRKSSLYPVSIAFRRGMRPETLRRCDLDAAVAGLEGAARIDLPEGK